MPSGKRRLLSVSGRHNDDRSRNVFRKDMHNLSKSLPTFHGDCRSPLDPCYVKKWLLLKKCRLYLFCYSISNISKNKN